LITYTFCKPPLSTTQAHRHIGKKKARYFYRALLSCTFMLSWKITWVNYIAR